MNASQSNPLVHQLRKLLEVGDGDMPAAAVAEDDDRRGVVEGLWIFGPLPLVHLRLDLRHIFIERPGQQHAAGILLVLREAVTGLAGNEDDLLASRARAIAGKSGPLRLIRRASR